MGVATGLIGVLPDFATGRLPRRRPAGRCCASSRASRSPANGAEPSCSPPSTAAPKRHGFYAVDPAARLADRLDPDRRAVPRAAGAAVDRRPARLGLAHPVPRRLPAAAVSLWLRFSATETPVFEQVLAEERRERIPLLTAFRKRPVALLLATGAALLGIGSYSLMNTYTLEYGAVQLGYDYNQLLLAVDDRRAAAAGHDPAVRAAGRTASARTRVVLIGAIGTLLVAFPIYFLLQTASFGVLVGMMIIGGILPTMSWAALGGLLSRAVRRTVPLRGDLVRVRGRGDHQRLRAGDHPGFGEATGYPWWHPAIVLAVMSVITAVSAFFAAQARRADRRDLALLRRSRGERGQQPGGRRGVVHRDDERTAVAALHLERFAPARDDAEASAETPAQAEAAELAERDDRRSSPPSRRRRARRGTAATRGSGAR